MWMRSPTEKLLLHICCAPCATVPIKRLEERGFEVMGFFYNPNIQPPSEYKLRMKQLNKLNIQVIYGEYEPWRWFQLTRGYYDEPEGGKRCVICIRMRLEQTALMAKKLGIKYFTTTLTVSPYKNADMINAIGYELGITYGINFLQENFKKRDGYKESIRIAKALNLYRQHYCGCIFSKRRKKVKSDRH